MNAEDIRKISNTYTMTTERNKMYEKYILPLLEKQAKLGKFELVISKSTNYPQNNEGEIMDVARELVSLLENLGFKVYISMLEITIKWNK